MAAGKFWAITSYFNPTDSVNRLANFKSFRRELEIPLIAVELSFGAPFQLSSDDADILIQIDDGDVMFQKEKLINVGLRHLPQDTDFVAWLDCDLIFERGWSKKAINTLTNHPIAQLFSRFYDIPRNVGHGDFSPVGPALDSLSFRLSKGATSGIVRETSPGRTSGGFLFGLAWAARADVIATTGLYDGCVVGNGDRAVAAAAVGEFSDSRDYQQMIPARYDHYLEWARGFHQIIQGNVGCVDTTLKHLWHGDLSHRQYKSRHAEFSKFDFNPYEDITAAPDEAWRWSSDKPAMHEYLGEYFARRREDGAEEDSAEIAASG